MAITEITTRPQVLEVDVPIHVYDETPALLLDHLLDHLHLLTEIASVGGIPEDYTHLCLFLHPRYQSLLDGKRESDARLIRLLHTETAILLTAFVHLLRLTPDKRPGFYRAIRAQVPFVGHAFHQREDDGFPRPQP